MSNVDIEEYKKCLGDTNLTDEQIEELLQASDSVIDNVLADYFEKCEDTGNHKHNH